MTSWAEQALIEKLLRFLSSRYQPGSDRFPHSSYYFASLFVHDGLPLALNTSALVLVQNSGHNSPLAYTRRRRR